MSPFTVDSKGLLWSAFRPSSAALDALARHLARQASADLAALAILRAFGVPRIPGYAPYFFSLPA
jgi:hypothetical protein